MRPYMVCDDCGCEWEEEDDEECCPECGCSDYEVYEE